MLTAAIVLGSGAVLIGASGTASGEDVTIADPTPTTTSSTSMPTTSSPPTTEPALVDAPLIDAAFFVNSYWEFISNTWYPIQDAWTGLTPEPVSDTELEAMCDTALGEGDSLLASLSEYRDTELRGYMFGEVLGYTRAIEACSRGDWAGMNEANEEAIPYSDGLWGCVFFDEGVPLLSCQPDT